MPLYHNFVWGGSICYTAGSTFLPVENTSLWTTFPAILFKHPLSGQSIPQGMFYCETHPGQQLQVTMVLWTHSFHLSLKMERNLFLQLKCISVLIFLNLGIGKKFKELHDWWTNICASTSSVKNGWEKCHKDSWRGPDLLFLRVLLQILGKNLNFAWNLLWILILHLRFL